MRKQKNAPALGEQRFKHHHQAVELARRAAFLRRVIAHKPQVAAHLTQLEQRFKNEAEAYANEVIPRARGQAARHLQEAAAYREKVVAEAQGEAGRFELLLTAYEKAPEITRERLYLETMESVLTRSNKVLVDVKGANNLMYLPLDRWLKAPSAVLEEPSASRPAEPPRPTPDESQSAATSRTREMLRSREVR